MASFRQRNGVWFVRYIDENGKQKEKKAGKDKATAKALARNLETTVDRIKAGLEVRQNNKTIAERLDDFIKTLEIKDRDEQYIYQNRLYNERFIEFKNIKMPMDYNSDNLLAFISHLRKEKFSAVTINFHTAVIKAFARYINHPIQGRGFTINRQLDQRFPKRALTKDEFLKLIDYLEGDEATERRSMSPLDRKWAYLLSMATGYRVGELCTLTPESFHLGSETPSVYCDALATKNSKEAYQAIPRGLVEPLREFLAEKGSGVPIFVMNKDAAAKMLRGDCKDAGVDPEDVYFHSLRVSYITNLVMSGASLAVIKELARHSNLNLTLNVYTKLNQTLKSEAVEASVPIPKSIPTGLGETVAPLTDTDVIDCLKPLVPEVLDGEGRVLSESREMIHLQPPGLCLNSRRRRFNSSPGNGRLLRARSASARRPSCCRPGCGAPVRRLP